MPATPQPSLRKGPPRDPQRWSALPDRHQTLLRFLEEVRLDNGARSLSAIGSRLYRTKAWVQKQLDGKVVEYMDDQMRQLVRDGLGGSHEDAERAVRLLARCKTVPKQLTQAAWAWHGYESRGHFRRRGRGQRNAGRQGDLFKGRTAAVAKVTNWLISEASPGVPLVVTGQPGAGKSAVLGRSAILLEASGIAGLAIHARGATHDSVLNWLGQLVGHPTGSDAYELIEAFRSSGNATHSIMIDALDECAGPQDMDKIITTVADLAALPNIRVALASRPLTSRDRFVTGSVLMRLGVYSASSDNFIDLDDGQYFESDALENFAAALLAQEGIDNPGPNTR